MVTESDVTGEYDQNHANLRIYVSSLTENLRQSLLYSGDNSVDINAEVEQVSSFWEGMANLVESYSSEMELADVLPSINEYNIKAAERGGYVMHVFKSSDGYCICYSKYFGNGTWLTPFIHFFDTEDLFNHSLSVLYWKGLGDRPGIYSERSGHVYPTMQSPELIRRQYATAIHREYVDVLTNGANAYDRDADAQMHKTEAKPSHRRTLSTKYTDLVIEDEVSDEVIDEIKELIREGERSLYKAWAFHDKLMLRERVGFRAVKVRYLEEGLPRQRKVLVMYNSLEDKRRVNLREFTNIDDAITFLNRYYEKKITEDWFRLI